MRNLKAYIESLNGVPTDDWGFTAYLGFRRKQMDIIFYEDIMEVPVSKYNQVVGSIENTKIYFERLGVECPEALNIPLCLNPYTGRYVAYTTMEKARRNFIFPFFIKSKNLKEFIPGLVNNEKDLGYYFHNIPDETEVMVSGKVNFISEYRCFIINDEIKGIQHYTGDFLVFPNKERIENMIKDYKNAPVAYSLDIGVTDKGETLLVECNDAWSLGSYGLDGTIYTNLLTKRWIDLTKNAKQ